MTSTSLPSASNCRMTTEGLGRLAGRSRTSSASSRPATSCQSVTPRSSHRSSACQEIRNRSSRTALRISSKRSPISQCYQSVRSGTRGSHAEEHLFAYSRCASSPHVAVKWGEMGPPITLPAAAKRICRKSDCGTDLCKSATSNRPASWVAPNVDWVVKRCRGSSTAGRSSIHRRARRRSRAKASRCRCDRSTL